MSDDMMNFLKKTDSLDEVTKYLNDKENGSYSFEMESFLENIKNYYNAPNEIKKIFAKLSSNNDLEKRNGINQAREVANLIPFFQPLGSGAGKLIWEECALIISERNDNELIKYLGKMLEWIEDLTWPGALIILDRLKEFKYNKIESSLNDIVLIAIKENRISWLENLRELIKDNNLLKKIDTYLTDYYVKKVDEKL